MAQKRGGLVSGVLKGSPAAYLGIEIGDRIVSVDGRGLRDELDFRFFSAEEHLTLLVRKRDGTEQAFEVAKDPEEPVGVTFSEPIFDRVKICSNDCTFCFVRQIPERMRKSLHQRDDDYRMSFLYGTFITLTNLTRDDWRRLEEQRLSPLRVSVHTTDPALRQELMRNPEAGRVMEHLRRLSDLGIQVHAQIVLLKGKNDGDHLRRTLSDLDSLGGSMVSVGVVPAVYTRYRAKPPSPETDRGWAGGVLDLIEEYARGTEARRGDPWVYGADELYLTAGREFPPYEYYGEFHQYENGIGVVAEFRRGVGRAKQLASCGRSQPIGRAIAVTGTMAANELTKAVESLGLRDRIVVCVVPNVFFGETVTVAGLLTGQDVAAAVLALSRDDRERCDALLIPSVALHDGRFLDDLELSGLSRATGIPALPVEPSPESLVRVFYTGEA